MRKEKHIRLELQKLEEEWERNTAIMQKEVHPQLRRALFVYLEVIEGKIKSLEWVLKQ